MKYSKLKDRYNKIELDVICSLIKEIEKSKKQSKYINGVNCISVVGLYHYSELVFLNEKLIFIDINGLHYSLFSECTLNDLILILNNL